MLEFDPTVTVSHLIWAIGAFVTVILAYAAIRWRAAKAEQTAQSAMDRCAKIEVKVNEVESCSRQAIYDLTRELHTKFATKEGMHEQAEQMIRAVSEATGGIRADIRDVRSDLKDMGARLDRRMDEYVASNAKPRHVRSD